MSVSIAAAPAYLLFSIGGKVLVEIANAVLTGNAITSSEKLNLENPKIHLEDSEAERIFSKEYKTEILDKDLLLKTLKEHGAVNIREISNNITCSCENFNLEFTKIENEPYSLKLSYNGNYNPQELVNDIGSEYTSNAQEVSYNKIKERLEAQNLEIEDEEIYDDNTIVLTVNLE